MPKVSVIIPVYNTEKFLRKCLDSVCNQTLQDIEIICINDCSTDGSLEILREYAGKDNRIKLIELLENCGAAKARNIGIDIAEGEYLGFVDSDDFIDLDFYKKLYGKAKETDADAVKGKLYLYDIIKPEINKAIYSDIDVIVLGDISEMYNENISGYAIAAVPEAFGCNPLNKTMFGISDTHKYFSSGNLIIDCNLWRKNNIIQKIREIEKRYRNVLKFADMEILNILFQDSYKELEPKYCYINQNYFFPDIPKDIFIRHYNGAIKPWHINFENNVINDVGLFWHYAKITMFYHELVDNCKNVDKNFILRQLKVYEMVNKAQARKRLISG